ncbi:hypothetical protein DFH11DRAFT_415452 [Phellopilus nigrolimitatus]|nr:hypothetical protein DFH11DRAFT_415452 [Phellopilus nigrolimitatus]
MEFGLILYWLSVCFSCLSALAVIRSKLTRSFTTCQYCPPFVRVLMVLHESTPVVLCSQYFGTANRNQFATFAFSSQSIRLGRARITSIALPQVSVSRLHSRACHYVLSDSTATLSSSWSTVFSGPTYGGHERRSVRDI